MDCMLNVLPSSQRLSIRYRGMDGIETQVSLAQFMRVPNTRCRGKEAKAAVQAASLQREPTLTPALAEEGGESGEGLAPGEVSGSAVKREAGWAGWALGLPRLEWTG